jgi:hypothetical protein
MMSATNKFLRAYSLVGITVLFGVATAADLSAPAVNTPDVGLISTTTAGPPPPPAVPLTPNAGGYVRVETNAGSTGCSINNELVACHTSANNWPTDPSGQRFHTVSVTAAGEFHWVQADLGALEGRVTLTNQVYSAQGWTIVVTSDGTTFTNGNTGHGMSVSDQSVKPF